MPWPVYAPVTEGDIARGITSPRLGGHSFPCSATNPLFGIIPQDTIKKAFEKITGGGGAGDYVGWFVQVAKPTVVQVPANKWGFWYNPGNGRLRLVARFAGDGDLYGVQLSKIP